MASTPFTKRELGAGLVVVALVFFNCGVLGELAFLFRTPNESISGVLPPPYPRAVMSGRRGEPQELRSQHLRFLAAWLRCVPLTPVRHCKVRCLCSRFIQHGTCEILSYLHFTFPLCFLGQQYKAVKKYEFLPFCRQNPYYLG